MAINWDNLAQHAQELLDSLDPDEIDPEVYQDLVDAANGALPPQVVASTGKGWTRHPIPGTAHVPQPTVPAAVSPELYTPPQTVETATEEVPIQTPERVTRETPQEVARNIEEVLPIESEPTTSYILKKSQKCSAQRKKSGEPCRAWATRTGYCVYHDPDYAETLREMQSRGGSRSPRKILVGDAKRLDVDITDPGGIQALIGHGLRLHLLGALTSRQTSQLTRFLTLLVTNSRTLSSNQLQTSAFAQNNATLLQLTDTVVERLEGRDLNDRLNVIQDAGSRREEVLKINDRWAPRPTYRSARNYP